MHAEATSEKQAMGHFLDGRASLVVGTHTHVPTADHRILPGGTAYMTDAGMCGDYDSVLGMQKEEPIRRFLQKTPGPRMEPGLGEGTLSGIAVETDDRTGLAMRVAAVRLGPTWKKPGPAFWEGSDVRRAFSRPRCARATSPGSLLATDSLGFVPIFRHGGRRWTWRQSRGREEGHYRERANSIGRMSTRALPRSCEPSSTRPRARRFPSARSSRLSASAPSASC